jgi:hypothetical protein
MAVERVCRGDWIGVHSRLIWRNAKNQAARRLATIDVNTGKAADENVIFIEFDVLRDL